MKHLTALVGSPRYAALMKALRVLLDSNGLAATNFDYRANELILDLPESDRRDLRTVLALHNNEHAQAMSRELQ